MDWEKSRQLQEDKKKIAQVEEIRKQLEEQRKLEKNKLAEAVEQRALEDKEMQHDNEMQ